MTKTIVYLRKSTNPNKKYMVWVDGKTVHFGARGMSDYTKHKDKDRMKRYSARHKRGGETWSKKGVKTAGFWSKWLLWNKPSFNASKRDIASKFNITFKSGWPSKGARKSKHKSRKGARKSRKGARKSRKGARKSRKGARKSRKGARKSKRKSHKGARKSKRKSRKGARK